MSHTRTPSVSLIALTALAAFTIAANTRARYTSSATVTRSGRASYGTVNTTTATGHRWTTHGHAHADARWDTRRRRVVGASLTAASFAALSCPPNMTSVGGIVYYSCGSTWYRRYYVSGGVIYEVVAGPTGY